MTIQGFSDLIYNNFLFDIPKILDLCVLYKNNPVLPRLVENLFSSQEKFYQDFKSCVKDIIKAIETSKKKLRDMFELGSEYRVTDPLKKRKDLESICANFKEIFEVIYYLIDFFKTLNNLLKVHPKLTEFLFEQKFEKK